MIDLDEVAPEMRADCTIDEIHAARRDWRREHRRPRAISAREALIALEFEALFVCVAAGNLANGIELSEDDHERLRVAYQRIDTIVSEVV